MEIVGVRPRGSTIGCRLGDDAALQAERDNAIVAQLPDPSLGIPNSAGLLYSIADCHLGKGDAQLDDPVMGNARPWRFPIAFGDEELQGR